MGLSTFLRQVRRQKGLTQQELARRAGCCVMAISKLETGYYADPHWSTVCALASALDVRIDEFPPYSSPPLVSRPD